MGRFRDLLVAGTQIPAPILHYKFNEIDFENHKVPNHGSLGSAFDLQIKGDYSKSKQYALTLEYLFDNTTIHTENEWCFDWSSYSEGTIWGGNFYFPLNYKNCSFALYIDSGVSFDLNIKYGFTTEGVEIDTDSAPSLQNGWNIITVPETSATLLEIYCSSAEHLDLRGSYFYIRQSPLYPDMLVTGNGVYGTLLDTSKFHFNIDSGWSTVAVRKPILDLVGCTWSKDFNTDNTYELQAYTDRAETEVDPFGTKNYAPLITDSISYGNSNQYGSSPLNKGTKADTNDVSLYIGAYVTNQSGDINSAPSCQQELIIWNRDLTEDQLKQYISDNIVPIPEVYYDLLKQQSSNTDEVKDKLIDFSGNGNHGTLHNFTYKNPVRTKVNWNHIAQSEIGDNPLGNRVDYTLIDTDTIIGMHVTKLIDEYATGFFGISHSLSNCHGQKFYVYVSSIPKKSEIGVTCNGDNEKTIVFRQGMNLVDWTEYATVEDSTNWDYIYCTGEKGKDVDFYVIIFPFKDTTNTNGFGYYGVPDFTQWNDDATGVEVVAPYKIKCTNKGQYLGDKKFNYKIYPVYEDDNIIVFPPVECYFLYEGIRVEAQLVPSNADYRGDFFKGMFWQDDLDHNRYVMGYSYNGGVYNKSDTITNGVNETFAGTKYLTLFFYEIENKELTITQLPVNCEYLQFQHDLQTYVSIDNLTEGFKTVFMVCSKLEGETETSLYDQRANPNQEGYDKLVDATFDISNENDYIAFNANNNGVTYINGVLNTTKHASELNDKMCITIVNDNVTPDNSVSPVIGTSLNPNNNYSTTMRLYKFLGFKEALSEKQIQLIIEKYGLKN